MNQLPTWHDVIGEEKEQSYFVDTLNFVEAERAAGKAIYPLAKDVFNAFRFTEFKDVKVVILGQDPYHGPNQAHVLPVVGHHNWRADLSSCRRSDPLQTTSSSPFTERSTMSSCPDTFKNDCIEPLSLSQRRS